MLGTTKINANKKRMEDTQVFPRKAPAFEYDDPDHDVEDGELLKQS
jgi:hypothetical protein